MQTVLFFLELMSLLLWLVLLFEESITYETKLCLVFSSLHCKDHLKSLHNYFGRIFETVLFVEIFTFIRYANNTTGDITSSFASFI